MVDIIITVFVVMNIFGFVLMGYDKFKAKNNKSRIKEKTFSLITLFGGILGIILGSLFFSHKTSKGSFHLKIMTMFALYILIVLGLLRGVM